MAPNSSTETTRYLGKGWTKPLASLMLATIAAALVYAMPALAQEPDPDGARSGAVPLGTQSPDQGRQYFRDKSLDRANGDEVDYYTFTTDARYQLGLGVRDQNINLDSWLENASGNRIIQSGPPVDPNKDQTVEWLKVTINAGTYYIRVQAMEDGQTDYYLRFGLSEAPANAVPSFGNRAYSFSIPEDAANGAAVGSASATDADSDTLRYSITAGNEDTRFSVGSTGAITTAGTLDYETDPSYILTVQADDDNGGTTTATVNIAVTDVAENRAPTFGNVTYSYPINEDANNGDQVGRVTATDPDDDALTYSITAGNEDGRFSMNRSRGLITVAAELDYEDTAAYTLTVQADDGNGGTATTAVNISVTDVDENTSPVKVPTGLSAETTDRSVQVTWTLPAQPSEVGSIGDMYLERLNEQGDAERSTWISGDLDGDTASQWTHTDYHFINPGNTYSYRVKLETSSHDDAYSAVLQATAQSEPPAPPNSLSATATSDAATLTWTVPEQPEWVREPASLWVMKALDNNFTFTRIGTVAWQRATTAYSFTDTGLQPGRTYRYFIRTYMGASMLSSQETSVTAAKLAKDPDSTRDGATALDVDAAIRSNGPVDLPQQGMSRTGGDEVDYYSFTTSHRYALSLGVWEVFTGWNEIAPSGVSLEDADGNTIHRPRPGQAIETTINAGTYYLRVEATKDAAYAYFITFGLKTAPEPVTVFDRLISNTNPTVQRRATADGVPYLQFLNTAPTPAPAELPASWTPDRKTAPQHWNIAAVEWWHPVIGALTPQNQDNAQVTVEQINPRGLWSDGATIWVTAETSSTDSDIKLFAYTLATGARDTSKDIDVATPDSNATGLWMDEDTAWVSSILPHRILGYHRNANTTADPGVDAGDRNTGQDFTLLSASYASPLDMWSDGENMYTATGRRQVHVHDMDTRAYQGRLKTSDIDENFSPTGVWSNGITMWVGDTYADAVYAYVGYDALDAAVWPRRPDMDIPALSEENGSPRGIWSDGMQLWVMDENASKVFIYDLPDDPDLSSLEISGVNLAAFSPEITDYSRNVAGDVTHVTVDAAPLRADARVVINPADATDGDGHQVSLVANDETTVTIKVIDGNATKTYTLTLNQLEGTTGTLSDDDSLSGLSLSGFSLNQTFESDVLDYQAQITEAQFDDGYTTTFTATPSNTGAMVTITPADSDGNTADHEIAASGRTTVDVHVSAQDGSASRTYTVNLSTAVRDPERDFHTVAETWYPIDLWSDGATMWILNSWFDIYAYDLHTGARVSGKDYNLYNDSRIGQSLSGMWSDGDVIWVSDAHEVGASSEQFNPSQVTAFEAQSYGSAVEVPSQNFIQRALDKAVRDLWSDGETFWASRSSYVGNPLNPVETTLTDGKLLAYDHATKARKESADISVNTEGHFYDAGHSVWSFALWSDGTTLWVVSNTENAASKLEAHELESGDRIPSRDIHAGDDGFTSPFSMWSDGRHMWVLNAPWEDEGPSTVRVYDLPANAKLFSLEMTDVDFGHFIHGRPNYSASVANDVDETTISYEQAHTGGSAAVTISTAAGETTSTTDADPNADGYQVNLATGENVITITVTAPNGTETYAYTITVTRAE